MKTLLAITLALSFSALAETFDVKGMHCKGCVEEVDNSICKNEKFSSVFETCSAELAKGKKNMGKINYTLKQGKEMDAATFKEIQSILTASDRTIIRKMSK